MKYVYIGKGKLAGKGVYSARNFKEGDISEALGFTATHPGSV